MKHRILYADQEWKQQRILVAFLLIGGVFFGSQALTARSKAGLIWLVYIPLGLLWGGFYLLRRSRHAVSAGDDGVHIGRTFSTLTIPYESIRTARVLPLRQFVPTAPGANGRKPYIAPPVKAHLDTPSLVLRFQGEPSELAEVSKKLGRGGRHIFDGSLVFPVNDAETVAREIAKHLPEGTGSNLGGARRRGRKRH